MTIGVSEALPPRAALLSEELLSPLGRRWRHVQGVAQRAGELALLAPPEHRPTVLAAAWLTTSVTRPSGSSRGSTRWTVLAICASQAGPSQSSVWSPITPAHSSRRRNAGSRRSWRSF